jgi:hypothetical protein
VNEGRSTSSWRSWLDEWLPGWLPAIPVLGLSVLLLGLGGWLASLDGGWVIPGALLIAVGMIALIVGAVGLVTPWLWIRVRVRSQRSPNINLGLPIPIVPVAWLVRFGGDQGAALAALLSALQEERDPIEVEVEDDEADEHVSVFVKRLGEERMTTSEERLKILKMVEDGKLKPDEAAKLLSALGRGERKRDLASDVDSRWLRIRVTDLATGKSKVNVNVPMRLVSVGMRVGARFVPDMDGVDMNDLFQALGEGMTGKIVDVVDDEDNERVEIFAE